MSISNYDELFLYILYFSYIHKNSTIYCFCAVHANIRIFINFKNALGTSRSKIPFGIAQIGKAFRNEITPRNFIFRSREFEQMEIEYFIEPGDEIWKDYHEKWLKESKEFL